MPWIEPHGDGYRVIWRPAGRQSPKRKSATFGTKKEAQDELRAITGKLDAQRSAPRRAVIPWSELVARFLGSRGETTTQAHRDQAQRCLDALQSAHGWKSSGDVRPDQCLTIRPYHGRVLRALLRFALLADQAVDARCLVVRPLRKVNRARDSRLLTAQQVADLIAAADAWHPADGALIHCIATYGIRAESLIHLPCSALNPDGTLTMPVKSGDTIRRMLRPDTVQRLRALVKDRDPDAPLFIGHRGVAWASGKAVSSWLVNSVAQAPGQGILDLRRFATTRLMDAAGQDARTVADLQGRRTVSLVHEVYQRSDDQRQRSAIQALPRLPRPSSCPPGAPQRRRKSLTGQ